MKEFNFTQPFAMRCDAEQFESVKNELEKMGYKSNNFDNFECESITYLHLWSFAGKSLYTDANKISGVPHIEPFNRTLCLALAAMTDKPDGIVGEWWMCNIGDNIQFIKDKLYQQNGIIGNFPQFVSEKDEVIACDVTKWFRKATADELIKYFTEAEIPKLTAEDLEEFRADFSEIQNQGYANLGVIDDHKYFDVINDTQTERLQKQIVELAERNTENERQIEILWKCVKAHVKQLRELEERQPEPKPSIRYTIATVADIINCTNESNIDNFLTDFKNVINTAHKAKAKGRKLDNASFDWIDDGNNNGLTYDID